MAQDNSRREKWGTIFMGLHETTVEKLDAMQEPALREQNRQKMEIEYLNIVDNKARARAKEILGQAHEERQKIIEKARERSQQHYDNVLAEAEGIRQQTQDGYQTLQAERDLEAQIRTETQQIRATAQSIHEKASREGHDQGLREAKDHLSDFALELGRILAIFLESLDKQFAAIHAQWQNDLTELITLSVNTATADCLTDAQLKTIPVIIDKALNELSNRTRMTLNINPAEATIIATLFEDACGCTELTRLKNWLIRGNPSIERENFTLSTHNDNLAERQQCFTKLLQDVLQEATNKTANANQQNANQAGIAIQVQNYVAEIQALADQLGPALTEHLLLPTPPTAQPEPPINTATEEETNADLELEADTMPTTSEGTESEIIIEHKPKAKATFEDELLGDLEAEALQPEQAEDTEVAEEVSEEVEELETNLETEEAEIELATDAEDTEIDLSLADTEEADLDTDLQDAAFVNEDSTAETFASADFDNSYSEADAGEEATTDFEADLDFETNFETENSEVEQLDFAEENFASSEDTTATEDFTEETEDFSQKDNLEDSLADSPEDSLATNFDHELPSEFDTELEDEAEDDSEEDEYIDFNIDDIPSDEDELDSELDNTQAENSKPKKARPADFLTADFADPDKFAAENDLDFEIDSASPDQALETENFASEEIVPEFEEEIAETDSDFDSNIDNSTELTSENLDFTEDLTEDLPDFASEADSDANFDSEDTELSLEDNELDFAEDRKVEDTEFALEDDLETTANNTADYSSPDFEADVEVDFATENNAEIDSLDDSLDSSFADTSDEENLDFTSEETEETEDSSSFEPGLGHMDHLFEDTEEQETEDLSGVRKSSISADFEELPRDTLSGKKISSIPNPTRDLEDDLLKDLE